MAAMMDESSDMDAILEAMDIGAREVALTRSTEKILDKSCRHHINIEALRTCIRLIAPLTHGQLVSNGSVAYSR
jgi:hypothetical protein